MQNTKKFNSREEYEKALELKEKSILEIKVDFEKQFYTSKNELVLGTLNEISKKLDIYYDQESNETKKKLDKKFEENEKDDRLKLEKLKKSNLELIEIISSDLNVKIELADIKKNIFEETDYIIAKNNKGEYIDLKSDDNAKRANKYIENSKNIEDLILKLEASQKLYLEELKKIDSKYKKIDFNEDIHFLNKFTFENKKFYYLSDLNLSTYYFLPFEDEEIVKEVIKKIIEKYSKIQKELKIEL